MCVPHTARTFIVACGSTTTMEVSLELFFSYDLYRYWHMAEDGCYIVALSSMEHPQCPVDPAFVRGEAGVSIFRCDDARLRECHVFGGWPERSVLEVRFRQEGCVIKALSDFISAQFGRSLGVTGYRVARSVLRGTVVCGDEVQETTNCVSVLSCVVAILSSAGECRGMMRLTLKGVDCVKVMPTKPCSRCAMMMPAMGIHTGEAHLVYTICPRRDSLPGHASSECMLACHAQVKARACCFHISTALKELPFIYVCPRRPPITGV